MFTQEKNIYIYIIRSSDKRILRKEKRNNDFIQLRSNFIPIYFDLSFSIFTILKRYKFIVSFYHRIFNRK